MSQSGADASDHSEGKYDEDLGNRTNSIRAAVLGANDGIVSTAGLVLGVAGATTDRTAILVAGLAGLVAGALSMAAGEYVSVSSQRDTERAALAFEAEELRENPEGEHEELVGLYRRQGLSRELAERVADELGRGDLLPVHARLELGIVPGGLVRPLTAAVASLLSFTLGAVLPLGTILAVPTALRAPATFVAMLVALSVTGYVSARLGGAPIQRAVTRNVLGGGIAMAVTYGVGLLVGTVA